LRSRDAAGIRGRKVPLVPRGKPALLALSVQPALKAHKVRKDPWGLKVQSVKLAQAVLLARPAPSGLRGRRARLAHKAQRDPRVNAAHPDRKGQLAPLVLPASLVRKAIRGRQLQFELLLGRRA
jgi:hypothetical protein